jgi:hypothetical protein
MALFHLLKYSTATAQSQRSTHSSTNTLVQNCNCNIKFLRILCASATHCVNCTSSRTTTDLVYYFSQHVDKLVSQTEPSAHKRKDRSREEGRICNLCEASILSAHLSCTRWIWKCGQQALGSWKFIYLILATSLGKESALHHMSCLKRDLQAMCKEA